MGVAAVVRVWPELAGVRIISECAPAWQGLARPSHKPLSINALQRAGVPANASRQFGKDGS
jgi:hypothetical protein